MTLPRVPSAADSALGLPEVPPPPPLSLTDAEIKNAKEEIRQQAASRRWVAGRNYKCPTCGQKALKGSDALHFEFPRGRVVYSYRNLAGARCASCGAQFIEPAALLGIEGDLIGAFRSDYEAKVTRIGHDSLGTYWPRDVVRLLGFRKDRRLLIEVLDPHTALLKVV